MNESPETQPSLLIRMRNSSDEFAWARFVDLYGPLIYTYLRRQGLQDADVSDLTQDVLRKVAGAIRTFQYSSDQGSFRGWLFTIVRNRLHTYWKRDANRGRGTGGTTGFEQRHQVAAAVPPADHEWDQEFEQQVLQHAAKMIRSDFSDTTWQAFWQTSVEQRSVRDTAAALHLTPAAVYLARSRVMQRLKAQVRLLTE